MSFWNRLKFWIKLGFLGIILFKIAEFVIKYCPRVIEYVDIVIISAGPCVLIAIGISIVLKSIFKQR